MIKASTISLHWCSDKKYKLCNLLISGSAARFGKKKPPESTSLEREINNLQNNKN